MGGVGREEWGGRGEVLGGVEDEEGEEGEVGDVGGG